MGINFTESQLQEMLQKNPGLKVSSTVGGAKEAKMNVAEQKPAKISLESEKKKKKVAKIALDLDGMEPMPQPVKEKKSTGIKVSELNKLNKEALISWSSSEEHFSILFKGAKLLSINQIFAILQFRKYEIFSYKKIWHEQVKKALEEACMELKSKAQDLPFFDDCVEITLFRQASRLVDEDAMSTMFKFIIDGLKRDENNPLGILAEDNPKIVHRIVCYSEKGEPCVGIKVKKMIEKKQRFLANEILER